MGCCALLGVPWRWQRVVWVQMVPGLAQGTPQQNTWGPSPSAGERVSESQAGHRDKTAHAGARARGESPSPPCCSVGHPLAPGPTAPSRQKGVSSSGPLPGVGVGGATHRLRWEGAWMGDGFMSETFSQEFVTTY